MPYVIKHKAEDRYICGSKSNKADYDNNDLVSLEFARIYSSKSGAKTAMINWAKIYDDTVFNQHRADRFRDFNVSADIKYQLSLGDVVVDQSRLSLVEIVPVTITL